MNLIFIITFCVTLAVLLLFSLISEYSPKSNKEVKPKSYSDLLKCSE